MAALLVLTSVAKKTDAKRLSRLLVEKKLAACVTVLPQGESCYVWKEKLCVEKEYLLLIKTRKSHFPKIETFFAQHHPYECPEILGISTEKIHAPYAQWLQSQTKLPDN